MSPRKADEKQSFINEARRKQIVDAAITTLDEIGYVNASLAQIAKRAGISTALISYHFQDKRDLMDHTLVSLLTESTAYVMERMQAQRTARARVHAFIRASLDYQTQHPKYHVALVEIIFNARTADDIPYYKLDDDEDEPAVVELQQVLRAGQTHGEFRTFHVIVMSKAIMGAIGEYRMNPNIASHIAVETYASELIELFDRAILAV